ncbi:glycosyltransferase [Burkholderia multivorans]|uniref:glycosyltransferase family 4 protein n=2 Tax=Burkholderia cepacia complex TaxID=87882 RepID=UPI00209D2D70|nr:glycosyltransferase [Burkholderia multivorans]MCO8454191.1 glycosyltransferase [Burkholderia multivorans]MCO8468084.1 glycosyltransferase [Burkholderia multivorans]
MNSTILNQVRRRHFVICNERLLPRFGVDRLLLVLGQSLARQGHLVTFVCLRCDEAAVQQVSPALQVWDDIGSLSVVQAEERAAERLRERWKEIFAEQEPDVVIVGGWPFFSAASVCAERGAKSVFIDAGAVPQDGMPEGALPTQRELRRIRAHELPRFSMVLPISAFIRETQTLPDRGSNIGVETILLGADHLQSSLFGAPDGGHVDEDALSRVRSLVDAGLKPVMLLGRFEPLGYKNGPVGLQVFERVHERVPEARLMVLAREGEFAVPEKIAGAVVFLGFVGDGALNEIMRQCDLGMTVSLWEGFNLPLAEMQWLSRPVLAFSLGAHPEVIADPWLLCGQPDDMVDKAVRILTEGLPPHLSEAQFERFRATFGWKSTLDQYLSVLARISDQTIRTRSPGPVASEAPRLVLVDCTNSSIDPANPGVIRVTRRVCRVLQDSAGTMPVFVRWDAEIDGYRLLTDREGATLATYDGPAHVSLKDVFGSVENCLKAFSNGKTPVFFFPEVALDGTVHKRVLWARARDMVVAGILYDIIPISHPPFCAREVVDKFPAYLEALASFDAIWSISRESLKEFQSYAMRVGLPCPPGEAVYLPGQFGARPRVRAFVETPDDAVLTILCVCSIEPRKNHRTLVEAYRLLRARRPDLRLQLVLVGHRFAEADDLIAWLQHMMDQDPSIKWTGLLSDEALADEFRRAAFTVYPSIVEGYGLPIMESLWMGKPCLCHSEGVMAELAEKGGCMTVNMLDEHALATAMEQLAEQSELRRRLSLDALDREIFDWADYGSAIEARIAECVG